MERVLRGKRGNVSHACGMETSWSDRLVGRSMARGGEQLDVNCGSPLEELQQYFRSCDIEYHGEVSKWARQ
eukprot:3193663-Amphidinium_carterae.1